MHIAVVSQNTEYGIRPDVCARAAEARGFESIWFPEHTHIPAARTTPYPLGGELPRQPRRLALAAGDVSIDYALRFIQKTAPKFSREAQAFLAKMKGG